MNTRLTKIFIVIFSLCLYTIPTKAQSDKLRKSPNLSLCISLQKDSVTTVYMNIGITSNIPDLNGIGINALSSLVNRNMNGLQISGIGNLTAQDMNGLQIGGFGNATGNNSNGVIISGLTSATRNKSNGLMIAGLCNMTGNYQNGVAIAGLTNISARNADGMQLSSLLNICGGSASGLQLSTIGNIGTNMKGVQCSLLSNIVSNELNGLQLCPIVNIATDTHVAVQCAGLTNICLNRMRGGQIGVGNYAGSLHGTQVGLINLCTQQSKGVQIGIINFSRDSTAHRIGLVNICPNTHIQTLLFGGNASKINIAVRFRNRITYSMLGVGTHYLDLSNKFSGCLFYRTGLHWKPFRKFRLSGDIGYFHIENFSNENDDTPERMFSIQLRGNAEYQVMRKLAVFASGGYGWTCHYDRKRLYEKKPIVELGIVLF